MGPGRVDLPAPALVEVLDQALPYPGQAQVRQLDQVERIDRDLGVREAGGDGLLERC